jgi:hypothetical protein
VTGERASQGCDRVLARDQGRAIAHRPIIVISSKASRRRRPQPPLTTMNDAMIFLV